MAHGHEAVWRAIGVTPTHPAFIQEQAGPESLRGLHAGPPTHRYAQVFRVSPAWGRGETLTFTPVYTRFVFRHHNWELGERRSGV